MNPPSHPELLDWLADDFVQRGWDQKYLHRLIMTSQTYRQQSRRTAELDAVDPENELWGRANLRRLEAEEIRDALYCVAGRLDAALHGASDPVTEDAEGKAVLGKRRVRDGLKAEVDGLDRPAGRRSIYVETQRNLPLDMLATFDQPSMTPNCVMRHHSTVATQALWFLNDPLSVELADQLAELLWKEHGVLEAELNPAALNDLYLRLFAKPASERQLQYCQEFLAQQRQLLSENEDPPWREQVEASPELVQIKALSALCQVLVASNPFLYVD